MIGDARIRKFTKQRGHSFAAGQHSHRLTNLLGGVTNIQGSGIAAARFLGEHGGHRTGHARQPATLQLRGVTVNESITLTGGTPASLTGNNTFTAAINLTAASTIQTDAAGVATGTGRGRAFVLNGIISVPLDEDRQRIRLTGLEYYTGPDQHQRGHRSDNAIAGARRVTGDAVVANGATL